MNSHQRHEARLGSIAARSVKPEHLKEALGTYAKHVHGACGGDEEAIDELATDEHAHGFFQRLAKANPEASTPPAPPPTMSDLRKRGINW